MLRFSTFLRNSTIHFRLFLYLETCFMRVAVSLLCRLQAVSQIHVPIYPYLISEGNEIVRPCYRHSIETVTLNKHVTKYKNMRKLMVEFLRKVENRCIKIAQVNSILSTKFINLQLFTLIQSVLGVRCDMLTYLK